MDAVSTSLPALVMHLSHVCEDPTSQAKDPAKANGMARRVEPLDFLREIALDD